MQFKDVEKELFDLLKLSLWSRSDSSLQKIDGEEEAVAERIRDCSWKSLLDLSKEQCVLGILADVLTNCKGNVEVSRDVLLNWIGLVMRLEQRNMKMNRMVISLFGKLRSLGLHPVLMKGQAFAQNYPNPLHRVCGDIDLYFKQQDDCKKAVEWAIRVGGHAHQGNESAWEHKHFAIDLKGFEVELHYQMCRFENHRLQRRLQNIIDHEFATNDPYYVRIEGEEIETVPPTLSVLHQLMHITRHLLEAGVGIRQICDLAVYIDRHCDEINADVLRRYVEELQLGEVAGALGYILVEMLGLKKEKWPLGIVADHAEFIIREIFDGGNFGRQRTAFQRNENVFVRKWHSMTYFIKRCLLFRHLLPAESRSYLLNKFLFNIHVKRD